MMTGEQVAKSGKQEINAMRVFVQTCAFSLLPLVIYPLYAENLSDPTRPPESIYMPVAGHASSGDQSTGLHSVIISKTRRAAIIDGQTVELGEEHGGARLIEVNEDGVVLQRAQGRQILALFPGVKIIRREAGENPVNIKSSDKELQTDQPLSVNKMRSRKHITKPTAHKEEK